LEGDARRPFFHGPGTNNFATSLVKDTKLSELFDLQFRAGWFNLFNHTQFSTPSGILSEGDSAQEAEKYRDLLRFVHIKDVDEKILVQVRQTDMNFEQAIEANAFTIIGQGSIDFPEFLGVLEKNGYAGWMVVEQDVKFGATILPPVESIAASLRYLQQVSNGMHV
jgi:hypothetical protein